MCGSVYVVGGVAVCVWCAGVGSVAVHVRVLCAGVGNAAVCVWCVLECGAGRHPCVSV